ncbi:Calexcitin-2 [Eumeta japonica]|uniref:Calexcitin-2 n=1 Tax=Eumeta variegata TaxID=151549 RepID=A0A4C1T397_EUMVA|nr:Calexcitin-2 [Eumeta japonica]
MVSDFRKKKLLHVFNVFFDINRSGTIDQKDFEDAASKIAQLRGWKAGDPKYKEAHDTLMKIWVGLQGKADKDQDNQVSADEWISMWDEYAKNPSSPLDWQTLYCKFIFELEDASSDGSIDSDEFSTVYASFGLDQQESKTAFQKMSKGNSNVSWAQFQELWREYFTSEDTNAPGNFIFGKTQY